MPAWKERVQAEYNELSERLEKLRAVLNKPRPDAISQTQFLLMQDQEEAMTDYAVALCRRLNAA